MDYAAIKGEIAKPAYNGQTDAQIATTLQAMTVAGPAQPVILSTYHIYNAIVAALRGIPAVMTTMSELAVSA